MTWKIMVKLLFLSDKNEVFPERYKPMDKRVEFKCI